MSIEIQIRIYFSEFQHLNCISSHQTTTHDLLVFRFGGINGSGTLAALRTPKIASLIMTERTLSKTRNPPGNLVLRLENQPNSDETLDEEDSLYGDTPTAVTPQQNSGKPKSAGKAHAEGNDSIIDVTNSPASLKTSKKASETPSHSKSDVNKRVKCPCGKSD